MEPTEQPKYRVKVDAAFVNGALYTKGQEVHQIGWPKLSDLEPANDSARRVADYWTRHRFDPHFPKALYNSALGSIHLPAVLPSNFPGLPTAAPHSWLPNPVPAAQVIEAMPQYRVGSEHLIGKVTIKAGETFAYLGWPLASFDAVNDAAKSTMAYYAANKKHPKLGSSPYCHYRQDLVLPELSQPKASGKSTRESPFGSDYRPTWAR